MVEMVKNFTAGAIWLIGILITAAVFIRFTYETATEAKARVIRVEGQMSDVADRVADRMIIINNQNAQFLDEKLDAHFEKVDARLQRIERKVGE